MNESFSRRNFSKFPKIFENHIFIIKKSKEIISKLSSRRESVSEAENEDFFAGMKKRKSSSDSLEDEINEAEEYESMTHNNDSLNMKMKKKLEYLEQKLEKKSNAFNELKRENLRLKDSVDRKKRTLKVKFYF